MTGAVPARTRWAVALLDVGPDDEILEIGGGPGVAMALVCDRLRGGRITGVDRSATAVERAAARNAQHVAAGRAVLVRGQVTDVSLPPGSVDTVFAVNVNVFWTTPAAAELGAIRRLLRPRGALHLVYEAPTAGKARAVAGAVSAALERNAFRARVSTGGAPELVAVSARPGGG